MNLSVCSVRNLRVRKGGKAQRTKSERMSLRGLISALLRGEQKMLLQSKLRLHGRRSNELCGRSFLDVNLQILRILRPESSSRALGPGPGSRNFQPDSKRAHDARCGIRQSLDLAQIQRPYDLKSSCCEPCSLDRRTVELHSESRCEQAALSMQGHQKASKMSRRPPGY